MWTHKTAYELYVETEIAEVLNIQNVLYGIRFMWTQKTAYKVNVETEILDDFNIRTIFTALNVTFPLLRKRRREIPGANN